VLGLRDLGNVLVKPSPFTAAELHRLAQVVRARGFGFVYAPGFETDNAFTAFFGAADADAFAADYPYAIEPATDDSPFFFQFGRWRDALPWGRGWREDILVLSGRLVLLAVLVQALLLSVVLLVVPLFRRDRPQRGDHPPAGRAVGYFFLVGLAFMLVEIALMQRFTLSLGSPVQALAAVLASLLVFAGAGSACAPRLLARAGPWPLFAALAGLIVVYAWGMPPLFRATLGLPWAGRLGVTLVLLAPVGFLMGLPFPAALERLGSRGGAALVGWAWAANGCASVIGPVAAVMLAMDLGFTWVLVLGAVAYVLAALAFGPWWGAGRATARTPAGSPGRP
jgi:hypothetical protein